MASGKSIGDPTLELLQKYDRPGPRYTSYPTAVQFDSAYDLEEYHGRLAVADDFPEEPLSLYVHLPFCEQRCLYCGCNVVITKDRSVAADYLDSLEREIELLARRLPRRRLVSQHHWGGGTPTYFGVEQIERLYGTIARHFRFQPDAEQAIEIDPRVTTPEQLRRLRELGFNRVSFGVQDFTPEVQRAIGRDQTEARTRQLYDESRRLGFGSINLDLIYGLPMQTPESFDRSMQIVTDLRPDRIAAYSYAFVPWLKAHQKWLAVDALPSPEAKLRLFGIARERLLEAGYVPIGMDHFALPEDELVGAMRARELHRNFMGYTVKRGSDMIGVGLSSIGDLRETLVQNTKKLSVYRKLLDEGRLPVERGIALSADDLVRREVITQLMCNFHLDEARIEGRFGIDFEKYFQTELAELCAADGPMGHGFVERGEGRIDVVGDGRLFVRNICMIFDSYLRNESAGSKPVYSRTV